MSWSFETLGNAIIQVFKDGEPILVTDPWLFGSAYFGSWEIERELTREQIDNALRSRFIWFSHGHPDHFNIPSIDLIPKDAKVLLPKHHVDEMGQALRERGITPTILPQKTWVDLGDGLRVLCVANENMDAILAIDAGGTLLLNKNDSPFCGEGPFFRRLTRQFMRSYLFALCAFDADMINTFDEGMNRLVGEVETRKLGCVWDVGDTAAFLGAQTYCCSSSQHVYVRPESVWANDFRVTWPDIKRMWRRPTIRVIPPYSLVDLDTDKLVRTHCDERLDPASRLRPERAEDWTARPSEAEWKRVASFAKQFTTLRGWQDFIGFRVGGETRKFFFDERKARKPESSQIGVIFHVPRASLLETVEYGYFDDLLIGNFMKTQLQNMELYPMFSPRVAKMGGNAKVYTSKQLWAFRIAWLMQSPVAFIRYRCQQFYHYLVLPKIRRLLRSMGIFNTAKQIRNRLLRLPLTS